MGRAARFMMADVIRGLSGPYSALGEVEVGRMTSSRSRDRLVMLGEGSKSQSDS